MREDKIAVYLDGSESHIKLSAVERAVLMVLKQFVYRGRTDGAAHSVWTAMGRALAHTESDHHKWGGEREDFYRRNITPEGQPPEASNLWRGAVQRLVDELDARSTVGTVHGCACAFCNAFAEVKAMLEDTR